MKKLLTLLIVVFLVTSCNKDDNPEPIQKTTTSKTTTTTCATSTWKYEVSLGTPVAAGTFQIRYNDEFGTQMIDTTITSIKMVILFKLQVFLINIVPGYILHVVKLILFKNLICVMNELKLKKLIIGLIISIIIYTIIISLIYYKII